MPMRKLNVQVVQPGLPGALAGCALAALFALPAAAIEGQYAVEGQNPGQERTYKGEAQIKRTGRTYSVIWKVGQTPQFGTGILIDKTFSIVFQTFTPGGGPGRPGNRRVHRRK